MASTIDQATTQLDTPETTPEYALADQLQNVDGGPPGYRLRRIILTNFWLYEHQVIEIPHGRLFLAGDNRSGKSTVLTAAITLAMDGDYRPERIDTFGKREKRIDYYVLGSEESNTPFLRDVRTSYIGLEFEWCSMEQPPFASELRAHWERGEYEQARFLTIGVAFAGNRNSANPITALRFLITDGKRLDYDIPTVVQSREGKRACDLKTFKREVARHGCTCETQREYEQKVAQYLFNFADVSDFRRLIGQLLYLRQPNLNSILSLESVRVFLDQSLPALPTDLIQRAAATLELMDALQEEIERRKRAYGAVERLHEAQQKAVTARASHAACELIHAETRMNAAQSETRRLDRSISRAEHDLLRHQERIEALASEQVQLHGKIAALEGSEGLQAAQRLSQAEDTAGACESRLVEQRQILDDAADHTKERVQEIEALEAVLGETREKIGRLLVSMQLLAEREAHWQIAAEQVIDLLERIRRSSMDGSVPDLPARLSSLLDLSVQERLSWLQRLRQAHREIEQTSARLDAAQQQEAVAYEAHDEAIRKFDQEREAACAAEQDLADRLDTLLDQSSWSLHFAVLRERAALAWNDTLPPGETVEHLGRLLQEYTDAVKVTLEAMGMALSRTRRCLGEARQRQGARAQEAEQARIEYEHQLEEPEFVPTRSAHRARARERLRTSGIIALPLYMLIDFAPEVDSQTPLAGSIEHLLEDAGLLDALVVPPTQEAAADALLEVEGLCDCRLDVSSLLDGNTRVYQDGASAAFTAPEGRWLRIDPAIRSRLQPEYEAAWEETIEAALAAVQRIVCPPASDSAAATRYRAWRHGLLTGITGEEGTARCIGKETRLREQRRQQEILLRRWQALQEEHQEITRQVEQLEREQQELETLRERLGTVLEESGAAGRQMALLAALDALQTAEERYQKARGASTAIRQQIGALKIGLQREAGDTPIFAADGSRVEQALESTNKLASAHTTLASYVERLLADWQKYRRACKQLDQDKSAEARADLAKRKAEQAVARARAELEMLQQLAREVDQVGVEALLGQLRTLQARENSLPEDLQKAREQRAKAEQTYDINREEYAKALDALKIAQQQCEDANAYFLTLLDAYPVATLADGKRAGMQTSREAAQNLLAEPLDPQEEAYLARKKELESQERNAENELFQLYSEVINLLHEYGPHFDEQGIIRFLNAERATPYELLERLGAEIEYHEKLLEAKERELFQNFLLEEMADIIGKHIVDAEQWVDRMNAVLSQTAFVGEYYHLRWTPKPPDQTQPGSQLGRFHDLLRKHPQAFKQQEVDDLVHAFQQEIAVLRTYQQAMTDASFAEALSRILDYRSWFQFEIYIRRADGSQQHLTNRFFKKGSGAEQYVTLYIPFFAALSALYESAAREAPRLIALDEAFDKVSVENTRKLLKFLASQHFQWIMSGPRATGEGAEIPACVKYTMYCQKEREVATGFPSFWCTDGALTAQVEEADDRAI
jgi:Putative exonuclease SbcCD, C subunit